jgi:LmbE family N-acetylglucosaminyl deacetylase
MTLETLKPPLDILIQPPAPPQQVSVVIPAFNEAAHIGRVLSVLREVHFIKEILVVDDGSVDGTSEAALESAERDRRIRVLRNPVNLGKGRAILTGCQAARSPYILLLDADLVNLSAAHLRALIAPVVQGNCDMTTGVFQSGSWAGDLPHRTTPWLSGQRCLRKSLLREICPEASRGYGLETALTVAARQKNWRCQEVGLKGLRSSAGLSLSLRFGAFWRKVRMWSDIGRAMKLNSGWRVFMPRLRLELRLLLILLLLAIASAGGFNRSRAASTLAAADLPVLDLTEVRRVLVISPHPDDEVLGAGGLIQAVLRQGGQVRVVMLTNGDGQVFMPVALNRKVRSGLRDFVAYGKYRQTETLEALEALGLGAENVYFLGYPDRSLLNLWLGNWEQDCPVPGIFTRAINTPYKNSYNPLARYCGSDLLADLLGILEDYMPDLVVIPHPNDDHPDHRAAGNFTRLALATVQQEKPEYAAEVISYLVHYGHFPQPRGYSSHLPIAPPAPLSGSHNTWLRVDLEPEAVANKIMALKKFPTQMRLLGKFLPSFARPNEIFMRLETGKVNPLDLSLIPLHETDSPEMTVQEIEALALSAVAEPANESTSRMLLAGADLVGWKIARVGNQLVLTADTRGALIPGFHYRILVKTPEGQTHIFKHSENGRLPFQRSFTARIDLAELGSPAVLAIAADVQQGITLERTGWYFMEMQEWTP